MTVDERLVLKPPTKSLIWEMGNALYIVTDTGIKNIESERLKHEV